MHYRGGTTGGQIPRPPNSGGYYGGTGAPPGGGGYGGYGGGDVGGYGGIATSPTPSYNTSSSLNQEVFKDKPRRGRGGSFAGLPLLKSPTLYVSLLAVLFGGLTYSFKSQQNRILKELNIDRLDNIVEQYRELEERSTKLGQQDRANSIKIRELERQKLAYENEKLKLQAQLEDHKDHHEEVLDDHRDELEEIKEREHAYKEMLLKLQESMKRFSKHSVIETFGPGPHRVQFTIKLPSNQSEQTFTVETAPVELMPHAIYLFLNQVRNGLWNKAWFNINGPHALQCGPEVNDHTEGYEGRDAALAPYREKNLETMSFPEYSEQFPHRKWTIGYTGRPGGPEWYINKQDNTIAHGPGGKDEGELADEYADPCFARVVDGFDALERAFQEKTNVNGGAFDHYFEQPVRIVRAVIIPDPTRANPVLPQNTQQVNPVPPQAQQNVQQQQIPQQQDVQNTQQNVYPVPPQGQQSNQQNVQQQQPPQQQDVIQNAQQIVNPIPPQAQQNVQQQQPPPQQDVVQNAQQQQIPPQGNVQNVQQQQQQNVGMAGDAGAYTPPVEQQQQQQQQQQPANYEAASPAGPAPAEGPYQDQ